MHTDTRENDRPCICDDCDLEQPECGCFPENCEEAAMEQVAEERFEGMRDAYD